LAVISSLHPPSQKRPSTRPRPVSIDWDRVERWSAEIAAGDLRSIDQAFEAHNVTAPRVQWRPTPEQLTTAPLRFLAEYWEGLRQQERLPHHRQVDALAMRPALGYIMLVDVVDRGRDFRYRLYGSIVARVSGVDLTGHLTSTHHASIYVTEFALASYRACWRLRTPLYTERTPALAERTTLWQRLALPLVDDTGEVVRFLVGSVPLSRDGRILIS
jgi:hypothetical protein